MSKLSRKAGYKSIHLIIQPFSIKNYHKIYHIYTKTMAKLTPRSQDYSEWYNQLAGELAENSAVR
jgi:hypothetical protein